MITSPCRDLQNSSLIDERASEWCRLWDNDYLIRFQRVRISYRAVGVGAAEGVTITVAVVLAMNRWSIERSIARHLASLPVCSLQPAAALRM
jgi:hypothetical protein